MMLRAELNRIAKGRLKDANVLFNAGRYDGAIYLCGYAVETALKARICSTLKWPGFPSTRREFEGYQSFRTHDLEVLLHLSGAEEKIKTKHFVEWSIVVT
ncbi:MAG: HEPN domain-containing protein [Acidobacteria bacterium]|nr:HEPN domain-containing protein [Acidobacteriota bacterium]